MRKTKIICTMGPSTDKPGVVEKLVKAGMNVARLNFSHGSREEQLERINEVKRVREELNVPVGILLDTKGPEIRIGIFEEGSIILEEGQEFILTPEDVTGDSKKVSVSFDKLSEYLKVGDRILVDDGLIELLVKAVDGKDIVCTAVNGGKLSNKKSINLPGIHIEMPYMTKRDREDIIFGIENGVDFIAASFVRCKEDILEIKKIFEEKNEKVVKIIAKIENQEGVNNADEILAEANGIMIARGDLGVEISFERLPQIQKTLIKKCYAAGKMAITATQMLDSMVHNPRPTRAEVSDVANAVYDGTSAIMLSGETAAGEYPVESVKAMSAIATATEDSIHYDTRFLKENVKNKSITDAVSHAACTTAIDVKAKAIVTVTHTGHSARMISKFRPNCPIIAATTSKRTYNQLALSWGVIPTMNTLADTTDVLFYLAVQRAKETGMFEQGDILVVTGGSAVEMSGTITTLKVVEIR